MTTTFQMQAINLYDSIPIKAIRAALGGTLIDSSPAELQLRFGEHSYLFVYRFGGLVFFNMATAAVEAEVAKIKGILGPGVANPTTETFLVRVGTEERVEFDEVELPELNLQTLRLVAVTVGQSAALEYFEIEAAKKLGETAAFLQRVARTGRAPLRSAPLLKVIGSAAGTRQHIVSNLAILDPPEETWKSQSLESLFKELQQNFDVDVRFRTLDRKLALVQDNIEILADLVASRRATILEMLVVLLIVLEIGLALLRKV